MRYANADHTVIEDGLFNRSIPTDPDNTDYQEILASGVEIDPYVEPAVHWKDARIAAYGPIGDQLDMQFRDAVAGTTTWKDHIAAVKAANPKE